MAIKPPTPDRLLEEFDEAEPLLPLPRGPLALAIALVSSALAIGGIVSIVFSFWIY